MMNKKLHVLAVAPYCDGLDVGEAWCAHQWVRNLAKQADVTLLTFKRRGRTPASEQLPNVTVVEWDEPGAMVRFERINSMLKPGYLAFYIRSRKWISAALAKGQKFDIAHQFTPIALRYPSPLNGFSIPYVIGPLGGSLDTPADFMKECSSAAWYTQLRSLDQLRLRHDRILKNSYANAAALLGVAPYVGDLLSTVKPRRFEVISELGVDNLAPEVKRDTTPGKLRLLHVGRAVRTKGLRDAIRAIALLPEEYDVELVAAGRGEEIEHCRHEAEKLGVSDHVNFVGQIPRAEVEKLYASSDAFIFPSFREPSGSVVFEALRHGLPIITANRGGPGHVVDDSCGIKVSVHTPEQMAKDLTAAICQLADDPQLRLRLSEGAYRRIRKIGLWANKIDWLIGLYGELIKQNSSQLSEVC